MQSNYTDLTVEQFQQVIVTDEFQNYLKEHLSTNSVIAHFTKKDGSHRIMQCTRDLSKIPLIAQPKNVEEYNNNPKKDYIAAYDLILNEWRAFKPSNLTYIEWR